jgi:acyl-CoA thioester hydrolase
MKEHVLVEVATVRVAFADTDAMGVVWHGNYIYWFEVARTELLRQAGFPYRALVDRNIHLPVIEVTCRYRKPARFDDLLTLACGLEWFKGVRMRLGYEIRRDGEALVTGHSDHAFTDGSGRVIKPPADVRQAFADLSVEGDD